MAVVLFVTAAGCREGNAGARRHGADTPALLRVIERSQRDLRPRAPTAEDRRAARERQVSLGRPRGARLRERAEAADATADSAGGAVSDSAPAPGPMETIRIVPAAATLRVGETATLALEALDSAGRRTHVPAARWRPAEPDLVSLDRTGRVTATAPGTTIIEAAVGLVRASARIDVLPVVRGRLLTLDGTPPRGMQVRFAAPGGFVDSAVVGADGRFEFRPPTTYSDTAELWIQAVDARAGSYHPMVARLTARETGPELRAVLVPTRWTIRSGTYVGATLDVSAEAALRRWRGAAPFARAGAYEGRRTRRVVGWAPQAFPLPVAFIREPGLSRISPADSVAFWASVQRFEEHLGFDAFRAADTSSTGDGRLGVEVVVDPRIPPSAVTWASWGPSGDLNDARVAVRAAADFRDAALVAHEMLHALGFGHALQWRSVMTRTASADVRALTSQDVAYAQLIHQVRAAQAAFDADIGFLEAAEGERRARR